MPVRILTGDCRKTLKTLAANSIHCVITSPPYYGLRKYDGDPLVWGGDQAHLHEWHSVDEFHNPGDSSAGPKQKSNNGAVAGRGVVQYGTCACGAWLGMLGLEPTPELYIQHLVECFREVRRVLRDDGVIWANIGDSYSGSHGNGYKQTLHTVNNTDGGSENFDLGRQIERDDGCKEKDLLMIPAQVAIALRQDGWYLRSQIPWIKKNCMPESVRDRPANAIEYVYLLSKSKRYYYDPESVRMGNNSQYSQDALSKGQAGIRPFGNNFSKQNRHESGVGTPSTRADRAGLLNENGRNRRNSDWFMETWQGLILDDDGSPLALIVNPTGFKGHHYATFPSKFVEPMIKASTSEKGVCSECGSPWVRIVKRSESAYARVKREENIGWSDMEHAADTEGKNLKGGGKFVRGTRGKDGVVVQLDAGPPQTLGWNPTCEHEHEPVPATVLDCFGGAATVSLVADRLGRDGISCELSEEYSTISDNRLVDDMPMFADVTRVPAAPPLDDAIIDPVTGEEYRSIPMFDL